jgi:predicted dehydrogenase
VLRAGIVGCDTSHVIAFTDLINDPKASGALAKVEVTVAYPGGSPDLPASRDRLPGYVSQLQAKGIKIVDTLEELIDQSDAVLLESVDGRVHLKQFKAIAKGKPVFIDKPAAASLADLLTIFKIADDTSTPVFTSSSLRFTEGVSEAVADKSYDKMIGCETTGPMSLEPHHPDLFWYGIHGVEPLFTIMGPGCESVSRVDSDLASLTIGKWNDGRIGCYRGVLGGGGPYAFTVYGTKGILHRSGFSGYGPAMVATCDFFITRKPPVNREDMIEIYAFMEAADESKQQGGKSIAISDVINRAKQSIETVTTSLPE